MTRIITAAVLIVIVITGCTAGEIVVHSCSSNISGEIDKAKRLAEANNFAGAKNAAKAAEAAFTYCEGALAVFINHSLVEDLGEQIARLEMLATEETKAEFLSELSSARVMLVHIVRDNHPTLLNIL